MSVFVDGINITRLSNATCTGIVAKLRENSAIADQADFVATWYQSVQARKQVQQVQLHANAWMTVATKTTAIEPSPESKEWSNLEGGHVINQVPSFAQWLVENDFINAGE